MSENKKTAIEWLVEQMSLENVCKYSIKLAEAKEMEKQNIINACDYGKKYHEKFDYTSEQYYKETYTDKP